MVLSVDEMTLDRVAKNARIDVDERDKAALLRDLEGVLDVFDELSALETGSAPALLHPRRVVNGMRADEERPSWGSSKALALSPHSKDPFFKGPKVVD